MEVQDGAIAIGSNNVLQLDTVRALHQTVVSLRSALEESKTELSQLREKYQNHKNCTVLTDTIQKLTLENHILRRKIIDTEGLQPDFDQESVKLDLDINDSEDILKSVTFQDPLSASSNAEFQDINDINIAIDDDIQNLTGTSICSKDHLDYDVNASDNSQDYNVTSPAVNESNLQELGSEVALDSGRSKCSSEDIYKDNETLNDKSNDEVDSTDPVYYEFPKEENLILSATEDLGEEKVRRKQKSDFKTKIELQSKFDVTIKVCASKSSGDKVFSSSTSDTDSSAELVKQDQRKEDTEEQVEKEENVGAKTTNNHNVHINEITKDNLGSKSVVSVSTVSSENIKMAVPSDGDSKAKKVSDRFNVQVRITSEENLVVDQGLDKEKNTETLNLDIDDLSVRSMSEGDNSVFSEDQHTPLEGNVHPISETRDEQNKVVCEQDSISGNESEEVDDIELIFTTDETKDISGFQEDLVSIREAEEWNASLSHATPVLVKFSTLDPECQDGETQTDANTAENSDNAENENQENSNLQGALANSSRPTYVDRAVGEDTMNIEGVRHGILKSSESRSEDKKFRYKSIDSTDSLTFDYNRGPSFDNTKSSSFELGSSMDILQREESMDSFHPRNMSHRFSLFAETDISKCGISEEDVSTANLNARRNTCPNPFQYRPIPHREAIRSHARNIGPFKATPPYTSPLGRLRPIQQNESLIMRRENVAQTDVSALPPRWSSDGYLAHKVGMGANLTTLPSKLVTSVNRSSVGSRQAAFGNTHHLPTATHLTAYRSDETRRVMLSDIGFTSMVPELSRSADPLWACSANCGAGLRGAPPPPPVCGAAPPSCRSCGGGLRRSTSSVGARLWSVPTSPTRGGSVEGGHRYWSRSGIHRSNHRSADRNPEWRTSYSAGLTFSDPRDKRTAWRSSLPELRQKLSTGVDSGESTDELIEETERYLRRSIDNLARDDRQDDMLSEYLPGGLARPYIPAEPKHLRLGHAVKIIAPQGRIAVGKVRYVGLAGGPTCSPGGPISPQIYVGVQVPSRQYPAIPVNDGTLHGRRYFRSDANHTAVFVPFSKVVMAWAG